MRRTPRSDRSGGPSNGPPKQRSAQTMELGACTPSDTRTYRILSSLRRTRAGVRRFLLIAEGQFKLAGDLGPKFAEHIESDILGEGISHLPCCRSDAGFVVWMVNVRQGDRACGTQPFRKVKH